MIALACCLSIVWTTFTSAPDAYAAVDYAGGEVFGQLAAGAELPIGWGVANRGLLPNHSTVPAATARKGVTARPVLASGRRPRSRVRCGQQPGGGAGMAGTTADRTAGSEYGWSGRIAVTPGQLIYNGMLGPLDPHHHVAIQLAIARSGILSAVDGRGRTATAHALVVPAGQRHVVGGHGEADAVLLYLDPAAPHGRLVNRGIARRTEDPADVTSWVRLGKYLEDGFDPLTPANDLPDRLVEALLTGLGTAHPDPSARCRHPARCRSYSADDPTPGAVQRCGTHRRVVRRSARSPVSQPDWHEHQQLRALGATRARVVGVVCRRDSHRRRACGRLRRQRAHEPGMPRDVRPGTKRGRAPPRHYRAAGIDRGRREAGFSPRTPNPFKRRAVWHARLAP
jgi:hypothetical protein